MQPYIYLSTYPKNLPNNKKKDKLTTDEFNSKKQTCFTPYIPPAVAQTAGKQNQFQESPWPRSFTPGELVKSIAQKQKESTGIFQ